VRLFFLAIVPAPDDESGAERPVVPLTREGCGHLTRSSISLLRTSMSKGSGAPGHSSANHRLLTGSGSLRKLNTET
jgi:hypothetical protein